MSTSPSLRITRLAVAASFFVSGSVVASWVPHIPGMQRALALSPAMLGLVLLAPAIGALVAMVVSGGLSARWGNARLMRNASVVYCALVPLTVMAPHPLPLGFVLALIGMCNGMMGVAMNAEAVEVERAYGKPIMVSFHALYSLGCLAGASVGGLAIQAGIRPLDHLLTVAVVIGLMGLASASRYLPGKGKGSSAPMFVRPTRYLALLGAGTFSSMLVEGAMADWAAIYMRDVLGAGAGLAASGFAAFSLAMVGGRVTGDAVTRALGPAGVVRLGGALATGGICLSVAVHSPWAGIVGFGLVGAGLATVVPNFFSAAGRERTMGAATAIASVSSVGFAGFLCGPPLIGAIAQLTSLPVAMGSVGLFSLAVWALAGVLAPARPAVIEAA